MKAFGLGGTRCLVTSLPCIVTLLCSALAEATNQFTSPPAGQDIYAGCNYTISWNISSSLSNDLVNITLVRSSVERWEAVDGQSMEVDVSDGSCDWTVNSALAVNAPYGIQMLDAKGNIVIQSSDFQILSTPQDGCPVEDSSRNITSSLSSSSSSSSSSPLPTATGATTSDSQSSSSPTQSSGPSTAIIVAIVVACIVGFTAIAILIYFCRRLKSKKLANAASSNDSNRRRSQDMVELIVEEPCHELHSDSPGPQELEGSPVEFHKI